MLIKRAIGDRAAGLAVDCWIGSSSAYSMSAVAIDPMTCCSWMRKGRFKKAGCGVSTVLPQRNEAKSLPGMARTLVFGLTLLRYRMARRSLLGSDAGWEKSLAMVSPRAMGRALASTTTIAARANGMDVFGKRRQSALRPAARRIASPRITRGVARSVERMASPAVVLVMKALSTDPKGVGSS